MRCVAAVAIACLYLGYSCPVIAAQTPQNRQRAFAALPDWTGLWLPDDGVITRLTLRNDVQGEGKGFESTPIAQHPPYRPEYEAKFRARMKDPAVTDTSKECGFYFPGLMDSPSVMQILLTPEEATLIFAGREIRHVYTDKRTHPPTDELWPTPWGDSIGHWEGHTLVIDTVSVATQVGPFSPLMSTDVHFLEKIRRTDKDHLEDQLTFIDPTALTRDWTIVIPYVRLTDLNRMIHGDCLENDRNPVVNGSIGITNK